MRDACGLRRKGARSSLSPTIRRVVDDLGRALAYVLMLTMVAGFGLLSRRFAGLQAAYSRRVFKRTLPGWWIAVLAWSGRIAASTLFVLILLVWLRS